MTFKQYLCEKWIDNVVGHVFKKQTDVFENPTQKELYSISGKGSSWANIVRGFVFIKTGKVVVFDPETLHTGLEYTDIVPYDAYDIENVVPVFVQVDGKIRPALNDPTDKAFRKVNKILKSVAQKVAGKNNFVYINL